MEEETKRFKCPNCKRLMNLDRRTKTKFKGQFYDKWICLDCSHIIVLDWRSEYN